MLVADLTLYFIQIPVAAFDQAYPFRDHYLFLAVFVPAIGLAAVINTDQYLDIFKIYTWRLWMMKVREEMEW